MTDHTISTKRRMTHTAVQHQQQEQMPKAKLPEKTKNKIMQATDRLETSIVAHRRANGSRHFVMEFCIHPPTIP